jgi:nucleotide-binding universal stress UspA family protein
MSHVFRKVLCPVDFGPNTGMTIEMARQVAEANLGTVILLHVVPMPIEAIGQPLMIEPLAGAEDDARQRLNRIASETLTHAYEIVVVTGDPAVAIGAAAEEHGADLIVMATHGRTGIGHFFLGSVTERVVRESPVPVMTVRAPSERADSHRSPSSPVERRN